MTREAILFTNLGLSFVKILGLVCKSLKTQSMWEEPIFFVALYVCLLEAKELVKKKNPSNSRFPRYGLKCKTLCLGATMWPIERVLVALVAGSGYCLLTNLMSLQLDLWCLNLS